MNQATDDLMAQFLTDRDQPCPDCTYNLRNLRGTRCPECGADLMLRVNLVETRQKLMITGLIGLSAGAGLNGLLMLYWMFVVFRYPYRSAGSDFVKVTGCGFVVLAGTMGFWLTRWRQIRRLPLGLRAALALACWGLTFADLVIFSIKIR